MLVFVSVISGMTPLQHASYKGNKEAVQLLLDLVSLSTKCPNIVFDNFRLKFQGS